jgi:hypothetical protein
MAPNAPADKGLSLQNTGANIGPAIQAADTDAQSRANASKPPSPDASADATDKPGSIAFRAGQQDSKGKQ